MLKKLIEKGIYFECQADCAACCKLIGGYVFITEDEAANIARYLNCSSEEIKAYFTRPVDDRIALMDGEDEACVFLENNRCTIYPVRPLQCRTFPFWPENFRSKSDWEQAKQMCPGIDTGKFYSLEEIEKILNYQKTK